MLLSSSGSFYSYTAVSRFCSEAADLRGRFCINFRQYSLASSTELLPHTFFFPLLASPPSSSLNIIPGYTNYRCFRLPPCVERTGFFPFRPEFYEATRRRRRRRRRVSERKWRRITFSFLDSNKNLSGL